MVFSKESSRPQIVAPRREDGVFEGVLQAANSGVATDEDEFSEEERRRWARKKQSDEEGGYPLLKGRPRQRTYSGRCMTRAVSAAGMI